MGGKGKWKKGFLLSRGGFDADAVQLSEGGKMGL